MFNCVRNNSYIRLQLPSALRHYPDFLQSVPLFPFFWIVSQILNHIRDTLEDMQIFIGLPASAFSTIVRNVRRVLITHGGYLIR